MSFENKIFDREPVSKKDDAVSVESLKKELAEDYKNFKDPNFYFPGGKSELENSILEKEKKLRLLEGVKSSEKIKGLVMDFMQEKSKDR